MDKILNYVNLLPLKMADNCAMLPHCPLYFYHSATTSKADTKCEARSFTNCGAGDSKKFNTIRKTFFLLTFTKGEGPLMESFTKRNY